jgi:hypothetical protein
MSTFPKRPITAATSTDAFTMTIVADAVIVQGVVHCASRFQAGWLNTRGLAPLFVVAGKTRTWRGK